MGYKHLFKSDSVDFSYSSKTFILINLWKRCKIGCSILIGIFLLTLITPLISSHHPEEIHITLKNQKPSLHFWFGTDELGRDLFVRVWKGAKVSLLIGIIAAMIDLFIGVSLGIIAGIFGGIIDEIIMRLCDILSSVPYLLMVILLTVVLGPGFFTILLSLTFTGWINMARVMRNQVLQIKSSNYFLSAIVLGVKHIRLILKYLIPNSLKILITMITLTIPAAIFTEAYLSFLGLGIQPPSTSLGLLAKEGLNSMRFYPWRVFFPSLIICLTILGFNLVTNRFKDIFDPRLSHK